MGELDGQVALVTGGAGGVGQTLVHMFASEGASVVLADCDETRAQEVAAAVNESMTRCVAVSGDVAVPADSQRWVAEALNEFGQLDVLVNNAAVGGPVAPITELGTADWEQTLRVNLTGPMLCSQAALEVMLPRRRGAIVNVASNVGKRGVASRGPYVSSKWGLLGLTQTLALEVARFGIRVNAVCPGPIEGARIDRFIDRMAEDRGISSADLRKEWLDASPMHRFVTANEVSEVILFLASTRASGMTGQAINVTAGAMMH